ANAPASAPIAESKRHWEVTARLADVMGFTEPWLYQSVDEVIADVLAETARKVPWFRGMTLERLKCDGAVSLAGGAEPPFADGRFPTPSGKVELFCEALAAE